MHFAHIAAIGARRVSDYDWSAESGATLWLKGDSGLGLADEDPVPTWTGKNPPSAYAFAEATNRPTYEATAVNGHPGVDFDGTNDVLTSSAMTVANMIGAASSAFFVAAVVEIDAIGATTIAYNSSNTIFRDAAGYVGMFLRDNAGTYQVIAYVYDGATQYATYDIGSSLPARKVLHMRLSGGNLYAGANGTEGTGVACGAVNAGGDAQLVSIGNSSVAFDGRIAEFVAKSNATFPTSAITTFTNKYV